MNPKQNLTHIETKIEGNELVVIYDYELRYPLVDDDPITRGMLKICEVCKLPFAPTIEGKGRRDRRYCSDACKSKAYRGRKKKEASETLAGKME